jgi:hypothetical protein
MHNPFASTISAVNFGHHLRGVRVGQRSATRWLCLPDASAGSSYRYVERAKSYNARPPPDASSEARIAVSSGQSTGGNRHRWCIGRRCGFFAGWSLVREDRSLPALQRSRVYGLIITRGCGCRRHQPGGPLTGNQLFRGVDESVVQGFCESRWKR